MKYNFRLEKVLSYKENIEGLKKSEHLKANQILNEEEAKLAKYQNHKKELVAEENKKGKKNINQLILFNNYLSSLNRGIEEQEKLVDESQEEVDKTKAELIVAMQEKKSFEILKEKDFEEFLMEEKKKEDKIVDEIVTFKTNSQR